MNIPGTHGMDEDEQDEQGEQDEQEEMNIYANADASDDVRTETENSDTSRHQIPQNTGSFRRALVCLVLLCVLLLTAVIVLCVHIHTNYTNCTQETNQLLTKITNLTEEREQLLTRIANFTDEREHLITTIKALKGQWTCYQSSLYYFSSDFKSWTESRRYCTERGADLIIINNKEKQDFVHKMSPSAYFWIGLADNDEEGKWKWVDGSTLTTGFWRSGEPTGYKDAKCVLSSSVGWVNFPCQYNVYHWICEKSSLN
ncbi:uncharacterized protein [Garra rufa]|uniref:uncharacterized protein n=1 Tax=Garra rufa TaxID=137080 RepID=UPI003CCEEE38